MTAPTLRCSISPASPDSVAGELLVLAPSLGTTTTMWDAAVLALHAENPSLRILRFDLPGHGASPATREPFSHAELADAVIKLVDETGGGRFHYAGVSFGGTVGIELAIRHPGRLLSLAIICSDAKIGSAESWAERSAQVRKQGTPSLVAATPGRWFADGFIEREPGRASRTLSELSQVDDESYALCCEALAAFDRSGDVTSITVKTIVVAGESDPVTAAAALADLAARIPGTQTAVIAGASHLAVLERPETAAGLLVGFLGGGHADKSADTSASNSGGSSAESAYARGLRVRRSVLGDAHVDAAQAKITPETADFQEFLTRYAWGEIWDRPGLSRRERSIATLASLVTGGHDNEIGMHVRAALANGLSRSEIAEVIMHTALYAGLPAANGAFAIAREIFAKLDEGSN
jgi:3-oxoadipate enol-lactonase/4-carboxymuconolactone decarboxylase